MKKYAEKILPKRVAVTIAALMLILCRAAAQSDSISILYYPEKIINYTYETAKKTEEAISKHLDSRDSLYITPNRYKLTFMVQYTNNYEYYRFKSTDSEQSITLKPDNNNKIGFYVGWKWLFLGWSFNIDRTYSNKDLNFSFYTSKVGVDIFYRKCRNGFKIRELEGFKDNYGQNIVPTQRTFDGIAVRQRGINVYYIFNNKHFSYPAAYSQTTNQRISCGSFILGFNYSQQSFDFDTEKFEPEIRERLSEEFKFNNVKYQDYGINFGYSYNWVFAKNCLANISLTPAVGYKNTSFKLEMNRKFFDNINFDFISRAAIVYNNSKWFVGASLISHTYSYRKTNLSIVNGFGTINVYAGINLFRKN